MEKIPFKTVDGEPINLWHYECGGNGKEHPCMLWIHGGGWHETDPSIFGNDYSHFTEIGIECFSVEYRLIGNDEDIECNYLKNCISDCFDAVRYIRDNAEKFNIDRNRVIVVGESAGGHLALCGATAVARQYDRICYPDMVIAYNPVTDITARWAYNVCNVKHSLNSDEFLKMSDCVRRYSPYSNIEANDIPLLLLTGLDDRVTYPGDVYNFYLKYLEAGNTAEIVFYPATEHAFALPEYYQLGSESRNNSFDKIKEFISKYLK